MYCVEAGGVLLCWDCGVGLVRPDEAEAMRKQHRANVYFKSLLCLG